MSIKKFRHRKYLFVQIYFTKSPFSLHSSFFPFVCVYLILGEIYNPTFQYYLSHLPLFVACRSSLLYVFFLIYNLIFFSHFISVLLNFVLFYSHRLYSRYSHYLSLFQFLFSRYGRPLIMLNHLSHLFHLSLYYSVRF